MRSGIGVSMFKSLASNVQRQTISAKRLLSDPFQFVHGPFVLDIAGVQRRGGFKQDDPAFLLCHRTMLYPARHHDKLALLDPFMPVAEIHAEAAFDYQEHLVFVLMMVKDELAVQLDELDLLSIKFRGDAGLVVFSDVRELLGDVDFGHGILRTLARYLAFNGWRISLAGRRKIADGWKVAELRSAWTGEGARPHTSTTKQKPPAGR